MIDVDAPYDDIPEHLYIGVTEEGEGPALFPDIYEFACWCRAGRDCPILPPQAYPR